MQDPNIFWYKIFRESMFLGLNFTLHTHTPVYKYTKYPLGCFIRRKWVHRNCSGTSVREYEALIDEDDSIPWQCILCNLENMGSKFPFGYLSEIELHDLYGLNFPSQLQLLPSYELRSKLSHISILDNFKGG